MDELLKTIKDKNLVFTVTTGRSGTKYLAYILSLLQDFKSEHEARPAFHEYFRKILNGEGTFKEFWIEHKLPYIAKLKESNYSDVSHVACKGFLESVIEIGIKPAFILLKRDNRSVAKSLLELGSIPHRTKTGLKYLLSPLDDVFIKIPGNLNDLSDYQLCYWYTLETARRTSYLESYFEKYHCKYVSLRFEDLTKGNPLERIGKEINLPGFNKTGYLKFLKNRKKIINQKSFSKHQVSNIDFEEEESKLMKTLNEV